MKARYEFDEALHPLGKKTCDTAYQNYLRAYYAGCALTGLLAKSAVGGTYQEHVEIAFGIADTMITELNKKKV